MAPKKKDSELVGLKHAGQLTAFLLIVWGFYRYLFKLPDNIEELIIKPVIWLLPVAYFLKTEKMGLGSIGFTQKKFFSSIYIALGLGILFAAEGVLINALKYGGVEFAANVGSAPFASALGLSFATAISEEIAFRGYIFTRVWKALKNEWSANFITSIMWALIHVPITIFVWKMGAGQALSYLLLTTIFGIGSAFVYARTGNIISSILLHVMWEWPIILFR